jgi:hypothetical protein
VAEHECRESEVIRRIGDERRAPVEQSPAFSVDEQVEGVEIAVADDSPSRRWGMGEEPSRRSDKSVRPSRSAASVRQARKVRVSLGATAPASATTVRKDLGSRECRSAVIRPRRSGSPRARGGSWRMAALAWFVVMGISRVAVATTSYRLRMPAVASCPSPIAT